MHEIQITMFGPRGVGKTSLLAAMYEQFSSTVGTTDLQLVPDLESSAQLQDRVAELKSLFDGVIEAAPGVQGTMAAAGPESLRSFRFGLGRKGKDPTVTLHFRDYPGGYHFARSTREEKEFLRELVVGSAAVVVPIDAVALMEEGGRWHEKINRPQQLTDLFREGYQELREPRLVILSPIKAETYLRTREGAQELVRRLGDAYAPMLALFAAPALRDWIALVTAPVQTVGGIIFSRVDMEGSEPRFRFRKVGRDAVYSPRDSEQPLRYLLRFLLRLHLEGRRWPLFNFLRDWLGLDEHLKAAIATFAAGCKTQDGFLVLQGRPWLG